jgi:hypothetical protein
VYWNTSFLSNHINWHLALHHLEQGENDIVFQIYDDFIFSEAKRFKTKFSIIDATSILYRLKMQNNDKKLEQELNIRWKDLSELCNYNISNCDYAFANIHLLMGFSAANSKDNQDEFLGSINEFCNKNDKYFKLIHDSVGSPLYKAFLHFDKLEFDKTVDLLYPIRYELNKIGGSKAQQDLFHQMLTQAALRSKNSFHNKIGLKLLNEREALKPNSKLTQRLSCSFIAINE